MSSVAVGMSMIYISASLAVGAAVILPARVRRILVGLLTTVSGIGGVLAGCAALVVSQRFSLTVHQVLQFDGIELQVDPLSGLFMLLIGAVAAAVGVYSTGYTGPGGHHEHQEVFPPGCGAQSRTAQTMLPVFVASMLLVPAAANVTTFLAAWELMALASLMLVLARRQ